MAKTVVSTSSTSSHPVIVRFKIIGTSPLLQNNPAEFIGLEEAKGMAAGKKKYEDAKEAEMRTYRDEEGKFYHPSASFRKAIIAAAAGKKIGKKFATSLFRGTVFTIDPKVFIDGPAYTIDKQPAVVGKARVPRCRPCWKQWSMRLELEIDVVAVVADDVLEGLNLAGRMIGIGDYRPEKGGSFGRFRAELLTD